VAPRRSPAGSRCAAVDRARRISARPVPRGQGSRDPWWDDAARSRAVLLRAAGLARPLREPGSLACGRGAAARRGAEGGAAAPSRFTTVMAANGMRIGRPSSASRASPAVVIWSASKWWRAGRSSGREHAAAAAAAAAGGRTRSAVGLSQADLSNFGIICWKPILSTIETRTVSPHCACRWPGAGQMLSDRLGICECDAEIRYSLI
jgi:hypothetical protein